jgi:hypothetical protein
VYGKCGFRPTKKRLVKKYKNNIKIINNIKLYDINLIKYINMTYMNEDTIQKTKIFLEKH